VRHWQFLFPRGRRGATSVPTTVVVAPASFTVATGATQQLTATVSDQFGQVMVGQTVSWSSSASGTASVSASGLVTGVAAGSATITATAGSATGTAAATVTAASVATTITVTPNPASVTTSHTLSMTAVVKDQFGAVMPGESVSWSTTDVTIATVNSTTGLVTGVAAGSCTITAIDVAHPAVTGNSALTVTASASLAFNPNAYPHSSTGLLYAYTDFRTSYLSDQTEKATELAQNPLLVDKLVSGTAVTSIPPGLLILPYTLMLFVETCVTDSTGVWDAPLIRTEKDYLRYCTAHGFDPEDGYIHYAAGATTYTDTITSIDSTGLVTLRYDTQTYANAYQNGDTVTIAAAAPQHNGTWTMSNLSVVGTKTDVNGDKVNTVTTFKIPVTGATSPTGTVTRTGDGNKTLRNRFRMMGHGNYPPARWCVNPTSTVRQAYEQDRLNRILAGNYTSVVPTGVYVDETAQNNIVEVSSTATVEYPTGSGSNQTPFYQAIAALWAALHTAHPDQWGQEYGIAGYTSSDSAILYDSGGKCGQGEGLLYSRNTETNWAIGGHNTRFLTDRLAAGSAVELTSPYWPIDTPTGGGGVYAADPQPVAVTSSANGRMYGTCLAIGLLYYDPINHPGAVAINPWNGGWSVAPQNSLQNFWPALYEVPLGLPTAAATAIHAGDVTDPKGQTVYLQSRPFQAGLVVYRSDNGLVYTGTDYSDNAIYTYTLPASGGVGNQWQRVRVDGSLDLPISTIDLRPDEGVVLLPAVAQPIIGPDASFNPTSGVVINPGDNWQTIINAHPAGTVYWIKAGTHSNQSITPQSGDVYWAEAGAIMDGTGTTSKAISGTADNVTIRNLEVKNYTSPFSSGAIQGDWNASTGWLVEQCDLHDMTLGAGLYVTDSITVRYNHIHHNGQIGLLGKANNTAGQAVIYGNEIDHNNTNNNDINNEAGGLKILQSTNVWFHDNYVHDNTGVGIWFDGSNVTPLVEHNRTINNTASGIMSELSYGGTIRYNTVTGNALGQSIAHSAILIAESSATAVYGNYLSGNNTGIVGIAATRGSGPLGPWVLTGLDVHDNTEHIPTGQASTTGIIDQIGDGVVFGSAANNHFDRNKYYTAGIAAPFSGPTGAVTFAQWQAAGYDTHGESF
jgi:hypothetical protein